MKNYLRVALTLGLTSLMGFSSLWGDWSAPINIYSNQSAINPAVGMDKAGNAVIIASASLDASIYFTEVCKLVNESPMELTSIPPASISSNQGSNNVAVAPSGNAVVAWQEWGNKTNFSFIRAATLINNSWSPSFLIPDATEIDIINFIPGVNIDSSNNALVVWGGSNFQSTSYYLQSNLFSSGVWQGVNDIYYSTDKLSAPVLSGNSSGQALAVWCDVPTLQAAVFDGANWNVNLDLSSDVFDTAQPLVAASMNAAGDGIIIWNDASYGGLTSLGYTKGNFGLPQTVYIPPTGEVILEIATKLDNSGNSFVLWTIQTADGLYSLFVSHYEDGQWSDPWLVDSVTVHGGSLYSPNIGVDPYENVLAVWGKANSSGNGTIYCNVFRKSSMSWEKIKALSSNKYSSSKPVLAMNASGAATVVWYSEQQGSQVIQASYTDSLIDPPLAPKSFSGKQVRNCFATQKDIVNILSWVPSPDPTTTNYYLFRNNKLLGIIPASGPTTYQDHNRVSKKSDTYQLTAVNAKGFQSTPLTVIIK